MTLGGDPAGSRRAVPKIGRKHRHAVAETSPKEFTGRTPIREATSASGARRKCQFDRRGKTFERSRGDRAAAYLWNEEQGRRVSGVDASTTFPQVKVTCNGKMQPLICGALMAAQGLAAAISGVPVRVQFSIQHLASVNSYSARSHVAESRQAFGTFRKAAEKSRSAFQTNDAARVNRVQERHRCPADVRSLPDKAVSAAARAGRARTPRAGSRRAHRRADIPRPC